MGNQHVSLPDYMYERFRISPYMSSYLLGMMVAPSKDFVNTTTSQDRVQIIHQVIVTCPYTIQ